MYGRPTRRMFSTVAFIRSQLNVPEPNMRSFKDVSEFITEYLFEANVAKYAAESTPKSSSFLKPQVKTSVESCFEETDW